MQLEQFKTINNNPYNARFRCPYCGDSKTNKLKTRGYLFEKSGTVLFKCHNCSEPSKNIGHFLKDHNVSLYNEYRLESLKDSRDMKPIVEDDSDKFKSDMSVFSKKRIDKFDKIKSLKKVSSLPDTHPAKKYIIDRKIPSDKHYLIYYTDQYYHWINTIIPDKFSSDQLKSDKPRIVFPFINEEGYVFGAQGRLLGDGEPRYITIIWDDRFDKIYGMERIDETKRILAVEGPIDSLFLKNCVAFAGSSGTLCSPNNTTIIMDNEPRNAEIVSAIDKYITDGFSVCIWPDNIPFKDVNDMVLKGGMEISTIESIIQDNTYSGLSAKMRLVNWKRA